MKKIVSILGVMIIVISLIGCTPDFSGSRIGNPRQLVMKFSSLDMTESQDLVLEAGDSIKVEIDVARGNISAKIQKDNEEPVYENDSITDEEELDVVIEEKGTYTVTVIGEKAKGSVSFVAESDD